MARTDPVAVADPTGPAATCAGLVRIYPTASGETHALRGVDVKVNLVGGQTCGKPYGFTPVPNCGTTYFSVEFQGVNAKGVATTRTASHRPARWRTTCRMNWATRTKPCCRPR